jgi:hypothetical protein
MITNEKYLYLRDGELFERSVIGERKAATPSPTCGDHQRLLKAGECNSPLLSNDKSVAGNSSYPIFFDICYADC